MATLSEKLPATGSIGVKDIKTDQAQVVVSINLKKKKKNSFLYLVPSLQRKNTEEIIIIHNYIPGNM